MQRLIAVLKWLAKHLVVRSRDLNQGEGKPKPAVEIGIRGEF